MLVGTLRTLLSCYNDNQQIFVERDDYVYTICEDIKEHGVNKLHGRDIDNAVILHLGGATGTVKED